MTQSFIWYYYTYGISKAILDLDPDLCQNFLFFVTLSILKHTDMYDTSKESCAQGLHFCFLHVRALSNLWGRYDPKTETKQTFLLVTVSFLHMESSVIPPLKASYEGLHFVLLTPTSYGVIYEDIMTKKHENLMVFKCACQQSDSPYLF